MNASQKITATPDDYFAYLGADTPAGQTHSFAIEVDSNVYYISDQTANRLASYSPYFRKAYDYCLRKYSNKFRPDAISFGSNGFNAYYQLDSTRMMKCSNFTVTERSTSNTRPDNKSDTTGMQR